MTSLSGFDTMLDSPSSLLIAEALRLLDRGHESGVPLRLFGSVGVFVRCTNSRNFLLRNKIHPRDIDFASIGKFRESVRKFLVSQGYRVPSGGVLSPYMDREIFIRSDTAPVKVEVFFDELRFVHPIKLQTDFENDSQTLTLDTLLMSKLQIRTLSEADIVQLIALLLQRESELTARSRVDDSAIAARSSLDYRCWRDFRCALSTVRVREGQKTVLLTESEKERLDRIVLYLDSSLLSAPRRVSWWLGRAKAILGIEPSEPEELDVSSTI